MINRNSSWQLQISRDRRLLVKTDGSPWFWLGDTAWDLFTRPTREDVEYYFATRHDQGFSVIQAVALMGYHYPLNEPNCYGHHPLIDGDPTRPNTVDGFWSHADYIIDTAAKYDLYIGLLPLWGYHIAGTQDTPVTFTKESAVGYVTWLAERYKDRPNLIWINGGDVVGNEHNGDDHEIWCTIGNTIKEIDPDHLMTFHPGDKHGSSMCFHQEDWLDFNMIQTGHSAKDLPNYQAILHDWKLTPTKPTLDGEPPYEDHPIRWNPKNGYFEPFDIRQAGYWSVFSGAFGHTYGHVNVWRFNDPSKNRGPDVFEMRDIHWKDGLRYPVAEQMPHLRHLMLSRPMEGRRPDQSIIFGGVEDDQPYQAATRGDGYAMVYSPLGYEIRIDWNAIPWSDVAMWWFDPRTGDSSRIEKLQAGPEGKYTCPGESARGNDWVLVIDDSSRGYPAPGKK